MTFIPDLQYVSAIFPVTIAFPDRISPASVGTGFCRKILPSSDKSYNRNHWQFLSTNCIPS